MNREDLELDRVGVDEAWESLRDEIETYLENVCLVRDEALDEGEVANAAKLENQISALRSLLREVDTVRRTWGKIASGRTQVSKSFAEATKPKRSTGRSPTSSPHGPVSSGGCTPEKEFESPILHAVARLGGEGRTRAVLREVLTIMGPRLTPGDRMPVSPDKPNKPIWRRTAQRARIGLTQRGHLLEGEEGVWALSALGWSALRSDAID